MGRRTKGKKRHQVVDAAGAAVVEDAAKVDEDSGDESSSDDSSQSSSSTSPSDDSSNSPKPSDLNNNRGQDAANKTTFTNSKTWDSMDGYEVRQNALKLLNASPDANEKKGGGERKMNSITYQSYHDLPYSSSGSPPQERPYHFSSTQTPPAQPPWGDRRYNTNNDVDDESLSVYHIASLTFNCMVHCLTEGYRAASSYYSSYAEDSASAPVGGFQSRSYEHVGSYQDNSCSGVSGCQSQYREVMDRDMSQHRASEGSSGRDNYQSEPPQRGDYTTVKLPSTYQGRK
ncbi:hypothetical protein ACHAXM_007271 [Skeletonema potamos]